MNTYFGALKDGIYFYKIKKNLTDAGVKILNYYPKFRIVKFQSEKEFTVADFDIFLTVEQEKEDFFAEKYLDNASEEEKINLMFRFIQYVERQIVLFDAIEDAAFPVVNNMEGRGSLRDVKEKTEAKNKREELISFLEDFKVRTVLTAHPM